MDNGLEETKPKKAKQAHPDRIKVSPASLARLNEWISQITQQLKGTKLTRSELVSFLILDHADTLSPAEMMQIQGQYFDEVKFAQWAIEELKARKASGEETSLSKIIDEAQTTGTSKKSKTQILRNKSKSNNDPQEPTNISSFPEV